MTVFVVLFILAILFVIGSAGLLKYFDAKHAQKMIDAKKTSEQDDASDQGNSGGQGEGDKK